MHFRISVTILSALIISGCGDRVPVEITDTTTNTQTYTTTQSTVGTVIANAGADKSVQINQYVVLQGQGSSSDNSFVTYQWREGSRVLSNSNLYPYPTSRAGTHTLELIVTNSSGSTASDSMVLTIGSTTTTTNTPSTPTTTPSTPTTTPTTPMEPLVTPTGNKAPIANAGEDKSVVVKEYITITGSGSDVDGAIVSYQWTKDSSILSNQSSFIYSPTTEGIVTLTLTVTDNSGAKSSDIMFVDVVRTSGSTTTPTPSTPTDSEYIIKKLGSSNSIYSTISLGDTPRSLYLLLSNSSSSSTTPTITTNALYSKNLRVVESNSYTQTSTILKSAQYVEDFDAEVPALIAESKRVSDLGDMDLSTRAEDVAGNSRVFYLNKWGTDTTIATAKKIIPNISTNMGTKTLNIWVSDDSFDSGSGCSKARCVTQAMVDSLGEKFLKSGLDNDIYDWVTNIYGEEWGANSGMLPPNDEITILITDIDGDNNPDGGVIGFFWSKDNFSDSIFNASNERVMFYIDSVMFANSVSGTWSIDDYWGQEVVATLAHEFQHMISFYQKEVLKNTEVVTWVDEMLSEATEDILATKLKLSSPRGVSYLDGSAGMANNGSGKYPRYNINNTLSLTNWTNEAKHYSKVSSFGAYLIRNYGGAKLLRDILYNSFGDQRAIVDAVNKTTNGYGKSFADLLHEWGIAVMLSEYDNLVNMPTYNSGDFTYSTYNSSTYEMGSINFFNYSPQPVINTVLGSMSANSNYFYKVGDNLTGDIDIRLQLNGSTEATLIAK